MGTDPRDARYTERERARERDSSDVVDGPVGDAHLVEPTDAESLSADLESLPAIDDKEPPDSAGERHGSDAS